MDALKTFQITSFVHYGCLMPLKKSLDVSVCLGTLFLYKCLKLVSINVFQVCSLRIYAQESLRQLKYVENILKFIVFYLACFRMGFSSSRTYLKVSKRRLWNTKDVKKTSFSMGKINYICFKIGHWWLLINVRCSDVGFSFLRRDLVYCRYGL